MNNYYYKKYLGFFIALIFSYFISNFFVKNIFLSNSPKIRPNLGKYFLAKISNTKEKILGKLNFNLNFFSSNNYSYNNTSNDQIRRQQIMDSLKSSLKPITKGVKANSKDGYHYFEFKLDEIDWVKITYTLNNGKTITVQYPKGTNPPPKEIFENR